MYKFIRKCLFLLPPETAHHLTLGCLQIAYKLGLTKFLSKPKAEMIQAMNLSFPNAIGLAAGFDRNGEYIDALGSLGFGFIEIGTLTPKPQGGNTKPRIFRLVEQEALINRIGFANKGVPYAIEYLKKMQYKGILGINIGKNKETSLENAVQDYLYCFRELWRYATYITINISSPNTPGLRDLQQSTWLQNLLTELKQEQKLIALQEKKYVPLVVKISPDLDDKQIHDIATVLLDCEIDGVIVTNTTLSRTGVEKSLHAEETGGMSGRPLHQKSCAVIQAMHQILKDKVCIIGLGGNMDATTMQDKRSAGANLLQVYTGMIFGGLAKVFAAK